MRVLIDTTFARRGPTGTGIYLERLVPALRAAGVDVVEVANEARRRPAGGGLGSARNLVGDTAWTTVELPRRAKEAGADLVHHPLPAVSPGVRQVVTVHDLAFVRLPEAFSPAFRRWASVTHRAAVRAADSVVAVSDTTALDLRARWGVPAHKIVVARHGPGQDFESLRQHDPREEDRHFLYVGDEEPRKNLRVLVEAYAGYRAGEGDRALGLVLAGGVAAREAPGVRVEPRPDADRLGGLHAGAAALVHPALHEGSGLTLLEAMCAGTPVLAARSPGVVETCGDAAAFFDPRDPADLAARMAEVAGDPARRRDLAERGRRRAAEFSWTRSARAHVKAYTLAFS
jgi:glycosyltransferase involved in cell wall biosynthesis